MNGGWSDWKPGQCSATCGTGFVYLTRQCNNPKPAHGGRHCVGFNWRMTRCNKGCCPGTNKLDSIKYIMY